MQRKTYGEEKKELPFDIITVIASYIILIIQMCRTEKDIGWILIAGIFLISAKINLLWSNR